MVLARVCAHQRLMAQQPAQEEKTMPDFHSRLPEVEQLLGSAGAASHSVSAPSAALCLRTPPHSRGSPGRARPLRTPPLKIDETPLLKEEEVEDDDDDEGREYDARSAAQTRLGADVGAAVALAPASVGLNMEAAVRSLLQFRSPSLTIKEFRSSDANSG